jgi:MFS transporter, ACS family, 4-hydroxyphenylacetate permease
MEVNDLGESSPQEAHILRKVTNRLVWFLFAIAIAMYLDRINVAFAALTMNKALGLTSAAYGLNLTFFSIGYIVSEIPSNMLMARFGARIWLPRIMITWGAASLVTLFATDAWSLYGFRFLVGLAEGGFLPGVFLYLSYWFPDNKRARVTSTFLMAQPVTLVLGAAVSGLILDMDGIGGLAGWRWLFLIEGLPSVILGLLAFFVLTGRPQEANWLSESEKTVLQAAIDRQDITKSTLQSGNFGQVLMNPRVLLLGVAYFGMPVSLASYVNWSPQIVHAVLANYSFSSLGVISAIPPLSTALFMLFWSSSSDRRMERTWHVVIPLVMAMAGWGLVIVAREPLAQLVGLTLSCAGTFSAQGIFFPFVTAGLSRDVRPVGLAVVSVIGIVGAGGRPPVVGLLRDLTGGFTAGLAFVIGTLLLSCVVFLVLAQQRAAPEAAAAEPELIATAG